MAEKEVDRWSLIETAVKGNWWQCWNRARVCPQRVQWPSGFRSAVEACGIHFITEELYDGIVLSCHFVGYSFTISDSRRSFNVSSTWTVFDNRKQASFKHSSATESTFIELPSSLARNGYTEECSGYAVHEQIWQKLRCMVYFVLSCLYLVRDAELVTLVFQISF